MSPLAGSGGSDRLRRISLFGAAVIAVGLADAIVLANVKSFFGSGYNNQALAGGGEIVRFLLVAAACDIALLGLLSAGFDVLLRPLLAQPRRWLVSLGLAAVTPVAIDMALHKLHQTLGDVIALDLVMQLAEGDERGALEEVLASLPGLGVLVVVTVAGGGMLWIGSGLLAGYFTPRPRSVLRSLTAVAASLVLGLAALQFGQGDAALRFGLGWKPSGMLVSAIGTRLTDFDFDGSGLVTLPRDNAPFDRSRHPFALEIPGNGIDENGLGGDLPLDFAATVPLPALTVESVTTPNRVIALVLLESFRADLIGLEYEGRAVTPHLNRLASESASAQAFTHNAMTWPARASMFQGRVLPVAHAPTLVDDFRAGGFQVAWFSGQHDGLRSGPDYLGYERADRFFDARDRMEQRTSRSAQPISLQVSWKTVLAEVEAFLTERDADRPLFLFVNLVDTHFPYDHAQLDPILTTGRLPRASISRENREQIWSTYLNTAAGVDRGIGQLRAALEGQFGADGVSMLVTADHGEAFYEPRFLGHGQALNERQTAVPFIAYRLGGHWPLPLALSDVRGVLTGAANEDAETGSFEPEPGRALLQYSGDPEDPRLLGLRTLGSSVEWIPGQEPPRDDAAFRRMARTWERARLEQLEATLGQQ
jgi:hypothetical protein